MAVAIQSGCDFFSSWSTEAADISATIYASTSSDGSTGPPAGTHMSFVGRYLDVINSTELNNLNSAGLTVFFYYENSGANSIQPSFNPNYLAATTYAQGVTDATDALNALNALGIVGGSPLSYSWPVYFAVDYDAGPSQWPSLVNYFEGVSDTIGSNNCGMYGSVGTYDNVGLGMNGDGYLAPAYFAQSRSSGWNNNANVSGNTHVWQYPPAYSPSGNVTINGHGVDGCFSYQAFFGQYGGGSPPPPSGTLTYATIDSVTHNYTQPLSETIAPPLYNYDQVLYSSTFITNLNPPSPWSWPYTVTGPATGINQYAYPVGNYSVSINGGPYQTFDYGFLFAGDEGSFIGDLPNVIVQPVVDSSGNISFIVTYAPGGSANLFIKLNIALLAYPSKSALPDTSVQQNIAFSNLVPGQTPPYAAYRRIAADSSVGTGTTTVAHNQPKIPNILVWAQDNSGDIEMQPTTWTSNGTLTGHFGVAMDATNIYFDVDSANNTKAWYRIYKDNN